MCLIHRDFKHFRERKAKHFAFHRNASSIMWGKHLSIMPANAGRVTPG